MDCRACRCFKPTADLPVSCAYSSSATTITTSRPAFSISTGPARAVSVISPEGKWRAQVESRRASRAMVAERRCWSKRASILSGAIDTQHDHVAGGFVESSVGMNHIDSPITALAGKLARPGMLTGRPETGMLTQALDAVADCRQPAPSFRSRSRLGQPTTNGVQVRERFGRVDQITGHPERRTRSDQRGRGWFGYGTGSGLLVPRLSIHAFTSAEVA